MVDIYNNLILQKLVLRGRTNWSTWSVDAMVSWMRFIQLEKWKIQRRLQQLKKTRQCMNKRIQKLSCKIDVQVQALLVYERGKIELTLTCLSSWARAVVMCPGVTVEQMTFSQSIQEQPYTLFVEMYPSFLTSAFIYQCPLNLKVFSYYYSQHHVIDTFTITAYDEEDEPCPPSIVRFVPEDTSTCKLTSCVCHCQSHHNSGGNVQCIVTVSTVTS